MRYSPGNRLWMGSRRFNATTSDVNFSTLGGGAQSLTVHSVLAYVYPTGSGEGGFGWVWGKAPSATAGNSMIVDHNAGSPRIQFRGSSTGTAGQPVRTSNTGLMAYNEWLHIAGTWSGSLTASSSIRILVGRNGAPLAEVTYSSSADGTTAVSSNSTDEMHIGNRNGADRTFNGDICYVARWNRILSDAEFLRAQRFGPLSIRNGLVLCWVDGVDLGPMRLRGVQSNVVGGRVPLWRLVGPSRRNGIDAAASGFKAYWASRGHRVIGAGVQ